jgi:outer membrane receptor protein involved in Fe transport
VASRKQLTPREAVAHLEELTMRRMVIFIVGLAAMVAQPISLFAGTATSARRNITGTVKDALGRPLAGVNLSLQNGKGVVVATAASDSDGHFVFKAIAAGVYALIGTKANFKTATEIVTLSAQSPKPIGLALQSEGALSMAVVAKRLNQSRNGLSPETGGSVYRFSASAIQDLPQGNNTALNDVLLQAPGVVQDSYGQLHVRGDHANLQYRINGVQLPEGITGFGQVLSPRLAQSISLLTGVLPAQFGLRTAGIIDIKTKDGLLDNSGDVDFYGGQRGTEQPSFEYGGSKDQFSYFLTGQYLHTDRGLEPPTPGPTAINDTSHQGSAFGYFSYFLNPTTRLSLITGTAINHFEIPANPDQPQVYDLVGVPVYPSRDVSENQFEQNYFGVFALQGVIGPDADYQIAPFTRYSTVTFNPDHDGDLIYNGAASRVFRSDFANGVQIDTAYHGFDQHTIRLGAYFDGERAEIDNHENVFPANAAGDQTSDVPFEVVDDTSLLTWNYSIYLQDEWKPIEQLTINVGTRFDLYDGLERADQASPRVGLEYTPLKGTTLHAGYARQFTPPPTELVSVTSIQKFEGTTGAPASDGNRTPTVERDHLFDVGATQQILPGLNVGVDTYYKKAADLIDEGQFGPALIFETFNYNKGRVYGTEFTGSYTHNNLYTYVNFAFSVAQGTDIESGQFNFAPDELAYIKNHYVFLDHDQTFTSSVGGVYNWQGFTFSLDGIYGSGLRSGFANTGNLPFYIQVDSAIKKAFTLPTVGKMEARLAVVNLFDHTYLVRNGTGIGVFANQYGPRRAIYGGLTWELPFTQPQPSLH